MARPCQILALSLLCAALALPGAALAESPEGAAVDSKLIPKGIAATLHDVGAAAPPPESGDKIELLDYDPLFDDFEEDVPESEIFDPLENSNRAIYRFNRRVTQVLWDPITRGYRFVVPAPARRAVRRVFDNLNAPIYIANHLVQLRPGAAAETLGAFAMNVSFGVGGLFDTASGVGFELKVTDFGESLALAGIEPGPYLVFPLLGPTTLRDGIGFVVDRGFHPATYFFGIPIQLVGYGGIGFAALEEVHDDLTALEASALDPYAVLRSAYMQAREQSIADLRKRPNAPGPAPGETSGASLASGDRNL